MGKSLVLTEKPSVGREIAKILNCHQKGNGCFLGAKYVVVWALGHLVTLADPEAYDAKYKTWLRIPGLIRDTLVPTSCRPCRNG